MKIRSKILLYFSTVVTLLMGASFLAIYALFAEFRQQTFQQQQRDKIHTTIRFINQFKEQSATIASLMDEQDIYDFYNEKLMVFDGQKDLLFSSLDNLKILNEKSLLTALSPSRRMIKAAEGRYDVLAEYLENNGKAYYAISKALDTAGYDKLYFLRNLLSFLFLGIVLIVLVVSLALSNVIARPIMQLAATLHRYDLSRPELQPLSQTTSSLELRILVQQFNELLHRTRQAVLFQKHAIHHISHQLKTPLAILVSDLENLKQQAALPEQKKALEAQVIKTKSLGNIINSLLEIAKLESGSSVSKSTFRVDELLYDIMDELQTLHPRFVFSVEYRPLHPSEADLLVTANETLIRQVFYNLLTNAIAYSTTGTAGILIAASRQGRPVISVTNTGPVITEAEQGLMFQHFFRGQNSAGKPGFGLGLVQSRRIMELHKGYISYQRTPGSDNIFRVQF